MNRKTTKILGAIALAVTILLSFFSYFEGVFISILSKIVGKDLSYEGNLIIFPISCLAILTILILTLIVSLRKSSHRREDLQKPAKQMAWTYTKDTTLPFLKEFDRYLNTSWVSDSNTLTGSSSNVLMGRMNERNIVVSDQTYSTGSGKNRTTYRKTIIGIELPEAQLPIMSLYPEGFMDKVFDTLSKYDIDFENRPLFSQKYVLYGKNEAQIRSFFNDTILAFYEQQTPFTTVCGGKYLVIYENGLLDPHEIMARLNFIFTLANLFLKK